ncbi:MAG: type II toxin-antitoxin system VapB family antitoxin [Actinomycetota bacterium]|nr:type II toxin-antitoxin system VapB family antitoxin [Actinomycetota bacterium]
MATRTNVVLDEQLVERVKQLYGLPTTRAAIDFALRMVVGGAEQRDMLDLEGTGWDVDLDELRPETTA